MRITKFKFPEKKVHIMIDDQIYEVTERMADNFDKNYNKSHTN